MYEKKVVLKSGTMLIYPLTAEQEREYFTPVFAAQSICDTWHIEHLEKKYGVKLYVFIDPDSNAIIPRIEVRGIPDGEKVWALLDEIGYWMRGKLLAYSGVGMLSQKGVLWRHGYELEKS